MSKHWYRYILNASLYQIHKIIIHPAIEHFPDFPTPKNYSYSYTIKSWPTKYTQNQFQRIILLSLCVYNVLSIAYKRLEKNMHLLITTSLRRERKTMLGMYVCIYISWLRIVIVYLILGSRNWSDGEKKGKVYILCTYFYGNNLLENQLMHFHPVNANSHLRSISCPFPAKAKLEWAYTPKLWRVAKKG